MLCSTKWLREFTPFEVPIDALADRLTMLGLEVEEIKNPFAHLSGVVVGRVVQCDPHPQADRLSLCLVDPGNNEPLPVVCGAPNVAAGQNVALAAIGTELPGGVIRKTKIRGQVSLGMICSEKELALGEDASGIMVLEQDALPGTPLVEALDLDTVVLDIGVTPNRSDCLSITGLAREVATAFRLPLRLPEVTLRESGPDCPSQVAIHIDDPDLCPLYQARLISDITVGPSPAWMRYRLTASGMRPINNIVDVTNYVLLETGQPLHAFDRALIAGDTIRVGPAAKGQTLLTLDGQNRVLEDTDLLIWDGVKPVALAGVMGGANSEVQPHSREVLLECAVFHPGTVRKTARRLALSSEASFRFERGVDQPGSTRALDRAAALMALLSSGTVRPGIARNEPKPWAPPRLRFRRERGNQLLGLELSEDFCRETLTSLGCEVAPAEGAWAVTPPSYRLDLEREVDLFEETARVFGVDRIPTHLPRVSKPLEAPSGERHPFDFIQDVKTWAVGQGLLEAINYSFVGGSDLDALNLPAGNRITICNPLSSDQDTLRTVLAPGMLHNVRQNTGQGNANLRLFEVAHVFFADPDSDTTAREESRLGILLHGRRHPGRWPWPDQISDYSDLKGLVEHLLETFTLPAATFEAMDDHPFLDPGVSLSLEGGSIGFMGRIKPGIAQEFNPRHDLWLAELDLDRLRERSSRSRVCFQALPKFPPVRRDLTLATPKEVRLQSLMEAVASLRPALLEEFTLVDVYQPEDPGVHNLTLRMTYRHPQRTLKDKEVDKVHNSLAEGLTKALPVQRS
ncbi:MAG: phenylalanine--tRNA ligase subunit beta [Desulfohalobiaceae bacterium]